MTIEILPALQSEALLAKSRVFILKALGRKESLDLEEFQLWASLALELLGKAALANLHPCLIADPAHYQSLFAAAGRHLSLDVKTITAKTLFERLRHLTPQFDDKAKTFCTTMSERRNAELHSGEAAFRAVQVEAWEAQYWHAADVILRSFGEDLDSWLGAEVAAAPRNVLSHAISARQDAARVRVVRTTESFLAMNRSERDSALHRSRIISRRARSEQLNHLVDAVWSEECPACGGYATLGGYKIDEEVMDTTPEEFTTWETVRVTYSSDELKCPSCGLELQGNPELTAVGIADHYSEEEEREMVYEPDYGND